MSRPNTSLLCGRPLTWRIYSARRKRNPCDVTCREETSWHWQTKAAVGAREVKLQRTGRWGQQPPFNNNVADMDDCHSETCRDKYTCSGVTIPKRAVRRFSKTLWPITNFLAPKGWHQELSEQVHIKLVWKGHPSPRGTSTIQYVNGYSLRHQHNKYVWRYRYKRII